ncbi:MAG: hypothetical protein RLZZ299_2432 [Pseudomonadota bacterium]
MTVRSALRALARPDAPGRRWVGPVLAAVCVAVLLAGVGERALPVYAAGEVADRDLVAPVAFSYVDVEATTARQEAAAAAVAPVFVVDLAVVKRIESRVGQAFDMARRRLASHDAASLAEVRADFVRALGAEVPSVEVDAVVATGFSQAAEDAAIDLVGEAMRRYVVADGSVLPRPAVPLTLVTVLGESRSEGVLDDYTRVRTVDEARQAIAMRTLERLAGTGDGAALRAASGIARVLVVPNMVRDDVRTEALRQAARDAVGTVEQRVRRGTRVATHGDVLTARQVAVLDALRSADRRSAGLVGVLAWGGIACVLLGSVAAFASTTIRKFARRTNEHEALLFLLVLELGAARVVAWAAGALDLPAPLDGRALTLMVPVAGGAVLARVLMNSETALVWSAVTSVLVGGLLDAPVPVIAYFLATALTATRAVGQARERVSVLRAGLQAGGVGTVLVLLGAILGAQAAGGAPLELRAALALGAVALLAGVLNAMVALAILPVFELFGFLTDHKLLELASHDHPLLRQLMLRAPGTYHHSVVVGTLAEAACESIGANALLARVACAFHDIGKGVRPQYFVENQRDGQSRHERLSPEASAAVIIQHVHEGAALAREHGLPSPIVDNIYMHHGTGLIPYFYARAREAAAPGEAVDEAPYRYPGPKPDTREAGVIMLADKVEAACRSIQHPDEARIRAMIQQIVNGVMNDGQLEECPLTVKEIYVVADTFTNVLLGIHHHRIEYPGTRAISSGKLPPTPRQGTITLEILSPFGPVPPAGPPEPGA